MGRRRKPENAIYPAGLYPSRGWLFWRNKAKVCRVSEWGTKAARDRWADVSTGDAAAGTVAALLDAFMDYREQLVRERKLAARTYEDNREYCRPLKTVFGSMQPNQVNSRHCTGYVQKRSWIPPARAGVAQAPRRAPVRANKELSLLSSAYTWAMSSDDWPTVTTNPCIGVERNPTKPKERCPERWEIDAVKRHAHGPWPLIFDFAYKCGPRGVQTRLLPKRAIRQDGILIGAAKGGAEVIVDWDDELIAIVLALFAYADEIERELRVESPYLIVSRTGQPYTPHGWKTTVYKIVRKAIAAGDLEQPFSFHDLRARSATDEEELYGTSPQHRLGHRRRATTDDYMRGRRAKRVKPLPLVYKKAS